MFAQDVANQILLRVTHRIRGAVGAFMKHTEIWSRLSVKAEACKGAGKEVTVSDQGPVMLTSFSQDSVLLRQFRNSFCVLVLILWADVVVIVSALGADDLILGLAVAILVITARLIKIRMLPTERKRSQVSTRVAKILCARSKGVVTWQGNTCPATLKLIYYL